MNQPSSRQYIQNLLSQGQTYASIGRQLGRDGSLIRQIALGRKPGHNLNAALSELSSTGAISNPPHRRTTTSGGLAKVRGRHGDEARTPAAPATQRIRPAAKASEQPEPLRRAGHRGRNTLRHETNRHPNGMEYHRLIVPKRTNSANRQHGNEIMRNLVEEARAEGRRFDATVWADIVRNDGSTDRIPIRLGGTGGYTAQSAFEAIDSHTGGGFGWLRTQISKRYPKGTFKSLTITGIDINTW